MCKARLGFVQGGCARVAEADGAIQVDTDVYGGLRRYKEVYGGIRRYMDVFGAGRWLATLPGDRRGHRPGNSAQPRSGAKCLQRSRRFKGKQGENRGVRIYPPKSKK